MTKPVPPKDAATILLLAPAAQTVSGADYDIFMVKRNARSGFMAGAYVFPGGVVDEADHGAQWADLTVKYAAQYDDDEIVHRIAAIRETFEESGVLLVTPESNELSPEARASWRHRVHEDAASFHTLCSELGAWPDLDALQPWARWVTPKYEGRRYDARFYVAVLDTVPEARHDDTETVSSAWLNPRSAIDAWDDSEIFLPPPTWYNLLELTEVPTRAQVRETIRNLSPIEPNLIFEDNKIILALPGDQEHPDTPSCDGTPRNRIVLDSASLTEVQSYTLIRSER